MRLCALTLAHGTDDTYNTNDSTKEISMASEKNNREKEKADEKALVQANDRKPKADDEEKRTAKSSARGDGAEKEKNDKKAPSKDGGKKKSSRRGEAEEVEPPRSSKLIHQFIPFIMFVLALLIAACLIVVEVFKSDMGIAGNLLSKVFCGLFGYGAFLIPVIIFYLGATWHKIIDSDKVKLKTVLAVIAMMLFSAFIHAFFLRNTDAPNFNFISLWEKGVDLLGGGVLGGLLCELLFLLFKKIGTFIIVISSLAITFMFLFNLTPKNVWTYIRYKRKLMNERKREKEFLERERQLAEEDRLERERRAEGIRRRARENRADEVVLMKHEDPDQANASRPPVSQNYPESEQDVKSRLWQSKRDRISSGADARRFDDPLLSMPDKSLPEPEEEKAPDVIINNYDDRDSGSDDDDGVRLGEIFNDTSKGKKHNDGGIIAIDLPGKSDKKPASEKSSEAKVQKPVRTAKDSTVVSMKVDTEALSELESLRGGTDEPELEFASYSYPPVNLLNKDNNPKNNDAKEEMNENARILRETLASFNIGVKDQILCSRGPTITRYELRPEVGIRVRSIANLIDDISLSLATSGVRIEAPIPNKPYVGIEVPNRTRLTVFLRSLIESDKFMNDSSKLTACLGSDVGGNPVFFDISKMPHLLIAGATGMGKSVCINSIIVSLLYKASPDEVKLILIDPKKVEFNIYKDIPHLYAPIVSDPKKAAGALASAVAEMERRFELIEEMGVRDINGYNSMIADDPTRAFMPKMVIIIDELADLMMTAPGEVESSICRLAQKARAAGIHIIIGTQRPSVDVITGLIKANVPSRIACTVASQVDSRTIIDIAGAEKLIGKGDMLFAPVGLSKPMRVQGCFVSDGEVEAVVEYIKAHNKQAEYNKDFISIMESEAAKCGNSGKKGGGADDSDGADDNDPKFREAVKLAIDAGKISTSLLQRMIGVGYGRAAKLIDRMEALGYVSEPDGNKPRRVLITMQEYMEKVINDDIDSGEPGGDAEE